MFHYVLSHSNVTGYDSDDRIYDFVKDKPAADYLKSYINSVTDFGIMLADYGKEYEPCSFTVKDSYTAFVNSRIRYDGRNFIEKEIFIYDAGDEKVDYAGRIDRGNEIIKKNAGEVKWDAVRFYTLLSLATQDSVAYFVVPDGRYADSVRTMLSKFPASVLKYVSCIEAIGEIPAVSANVVICNCIRPGDERTFLSRINKTANRVVIGFMNDKLTFDIEIESPSYSSAGLYNIKELNKTVSCGSVCEGYLNGIKELHCSQEGFFNYNAYRFIKDNYPGCANKIFAGRDEKKQIETLLLRE